MKYLSKNVTISALNIYEHHNAIKEHIAYKMATMPLSDEVDDILSELYLKLSIMFNNDSTKILKSSYIAKMINSILINKIRKKTTTSIEFDDNLYVSNNTDVDFDFEENEIDIFKILKSSLSQIEFEILTKSTDVAVKDIAIELDKSANYVYSILRIAKDKSKKILKNYEQ